MSRRCYDPWDADDIWDYPRDNPRNDPCDADDPWDDPWDAGDQWGDPWDDPGPGTLMMIHGTLMIHVMIHREYPWDVDDPGIQGALMIQGS